MKRMKPVKSIDDAFEAAAVLGRALMEDPEGATAVLAGATESVPMAVAEDGSEAIFRITMRAEHACASEVEELVSVP
ncbi:hypothetical protein EPN44_10380 [bacterium]|nr:MAG: hypothetical protein EPN44_10380 [bacterium]